MIYTIQNNPAGGPVTVHSAQRNGDANPFSRRTVDTHRCVQPILTLQNLTAARPTPVPTQQSLSAVRPTPVPAWQNPSAALPTPFSGGQNLAPGLRVENAIGQINKAAGKLRNCSWQINKTACGLRNCSMQIDKTAGKLRNHPWRLYKTTDRRPNPAPHPHQTALHSSIHARQYASAARRSLRSVWQQASATLPTVFAVPHRATAAGRAFGPAQQGVAACRCQCKFIIH